jgi:hypothetical protein
LLSARRRDDSRYLGVRFVGYGTQKLCLIVDLFHEPELIGL